MNKINLIFFYQFGRELEPAKHAATGEPTFDTWRKLSGAVLTLSSFLLESRNIPMPNTTRAARALYSHIHTVSSRVFAAIRDGREEPITIQENSTLSRLLNDFEREFEHDSREINVFSVSDKGTHSTTKLLNDAHLNLPEDTRTRLSGEVINDLKAAGRCLGFDTPTAAAFHILRAVEPLIVEYHNRVTGRTLPPRSRNWGAYINGLRQVTAVGADPRVVAMIDHIREFYRNPIMHPEETLTPDQALSLFYTCLSAIVQLDAAIQSVTAGGAVPAPPPSASTP